MRPVLVYHYWYFGTAVRFLQDVDVGTPIHPVGMVLDCMNTVFDRLGSLKLSVSYETLAAERLSKLHKELKDSDPKAVLSPNQTRILRREVDNLRLTLEAELRCIEAYVLSGKRLDVKRMLSDVPSLFAPSVFTTISPLAQGDLTEAARCIAFECPTAGAFHLMRATEDVLRDFYRFYVKRDRCDPLLWFPIVQALKQHRKVKAHDALLRNLDNIRVSFRNPTQHPDKVYDIHEVQDLWGVCADVINRMGKVLATKA